MHESPYLATVRVSCLFQRKGVSLKFYYWDKTMHSLEVWYQL